MRIAPWRPREIRLVSPRLLANPSVTLAEDDVFVHRPDFDSRFDVLRAANILNLAYFDDEIIRTATRNLQSRIRPGGLFVVCRTDDEETNRATVFRFENGLLTPIARLAGGSEVESIL